MLRSREQWLPPSGIFIDFLVFPKLQIIVMVPSLGGEGEVQYSVVSTAGTTTRW